MKVCCFIVPVTLVKRTVRIHNSVATHEKEQHLYFVTIRSDGAPFNQIPFFTGSILEGPDPNALKPYAVMVSCSVFSYLMVSVVLSSIKIIINNYSSESIAMRARGIIIVLVKSN